MENKEKAYEECFRLMEEAERVLKGAVLPDSLPHTPLPQFNTHPSDPTTPPLTHKVNSLKVLAEKLAKKQKERQKITGKVSPRPPQTASTYQRGLFDNQSTLSNSLSEEKESSLPARQDWQSVAPKSIQKDFFQKEKPQTTVGHVSLTQLRSLVDACTDCPLYQRRNKVVFGSGPIPSSLMIVGEGPGENESISGNLFVGRSGDELDKWLKAIGLDMRGDVYLSNVIKCFPGKRQPEPAELASCKKYLDRQIQIVQPKLILCLGKVAGQELSGTALSLTKMRGTLYQYHRVPVLVTYHPAAVLRNPEWKLPVWHDLQRVAKQLGIQIPHRGKR